MLQPLFQGFGHQDDMVCVEGAMLHYLDLYPLMDKDRQRH